MASSQYFFSVEIESESLTSLNLSILDQATITNPINFPPFIPTLEAQNLDVSQRAQIGNLTVTGPASILITDVDSINAGNLTVNVLAVDTTLTSSNNQIVNFEALNSLVITGNILFNSTSVLNILQLLTALTQTNTQQLTNTTETNMTLYNIKNSTGSAIGALTTTASDNILFAVFNNTANIVFFTANIQTLFINASGGYISPSLLINNANQPSNPVYVNVQNGVLIQNGASSKATNFDFQQSATIIKLLLDQDAEKMTSSVPLTCVGTGYLPIPGVNLQSPLNVECSVSVANHVFNSNAADATVSFYAAFFSGDAFSPNPILGTLPLGNIQLISASGPLALCPTNQTKASGVYLSDSQSKMQMNAVIVNLAEGGDRIQATETTMTGSVSANNVKAVSLRSSKFAITTVSGTPNIVTTKNATIGNLTVTNNLVINRKTVVIKSTSSNEYIEFNCISTAPQNGKTPSVMELTIMGFGNSGYYSQRSRIVFIVPDNLVVGDEITLSDLAYDSSNELGLQISNNYLVAKYPKLQAIFRDPTRPYNTMYQQGAINEEFNTNPLNQPPYYFLQNEQSVFPGFSGDVQVSLAQIPGQPLANFQVQITPDLNLPMFLHAQLIAISNVVIA